MSTDPIRIGTRDSELALWQAQLVHDLLAQHGLPARLVPIKSQGDIDLVTPLYAMGVQGVFTRSLDIALLNQSIDIAVHSMKDVPVQLPAGIVEAAVLKRASYKDLLVFGPHLNAEQQQLLEQEDPADLKTIPLQVATSSIRRKAQWWHRYPGSRIENLRGNVNTRLQKLADSNWQGAIFAAAGLERIGRRPTGSMELDWMLPAPAQGAIMVVARSGDNPVLEACHLLHDASTATCVHQERNFLSALMGGCSTPISALALPHEDGILFSGNIVSPDGSDMATVQKTFTTAQMGEAGFLSARELLAGGGQQILDQLNSDK
ncbi:hydroxymethylbilane synthase [Niabella terrae]